VQEIFQNKGGQADGKEIVKDEQEKIQKNT